MTWSSLDGMMTTVGRILTICRKIMVHFCVGIAGAKNSVTADIFMYLMKTVI